MNGNDKQSAAAQEALVCERCGRCRDGDFANCKNARSLAEASKAAIPFVAYAYSKGIDGAESAGRAIESAIVASVDAATAWADGYASGLIDERTSDDNIGIAGFGAKIDPARANPYLLAAPVAAAPVCGDCSTPLLYECIGCSATNYPPRTPAAPGIDLSQIKLLVLAWRYMEGGNGSMASQNRKDVFRRCANDLEKALSRIDASPKGGHCTTCACDPNMTPAIRFDLSPAMVEGEVRNHLIALGWTPPDSPKGGSDAHDAARLDWLAQHGASLRKDPNDSLWYLVSPYRMGNAIVDDHKRAVSPRAAVDAAMEATSAEVGS